MNRSSGAASRQLIGIAIAPRWLAAKIVARNSMLLYDSSPTTSPAPTPGLEPGRECRRPFLHRLVGDDVGRRRRRAACRRAARVVFEHSEPAHVGTHPRSPPTARRTRRRPRSPTPSSSVDASLGKVRVGAHQVVGGAEPERVLGGDGVDRLLRQVFVDSRQERSGAHAVDADPVARVLDRRDLGELDHRGLRRAVRRGVGPRGETRDGGGEDDRPRLLCPHDGHRGADAVDGAEDVDPEGALPLLGRQVVDATVRGKHAGVADQHVEPAEALHRERDHRFDVGDLTHVGRQRLDRAAMLRQARHGGFE